MLEQTAQESPACEPCFSRDLGILEIPRAEAIMCNARSLRLEGKSPDLLLFLAHPRTVALGLRDSKPAHPKDLLVSLERLEHEGIALVRSVRGGGITYHWPGQVACYPIVKLGPAEMDIPRYMKKLEQVALDALGRFGVNATRRRGKAAYIGLWHEGAKVASMGVRVSRWVTSFGFAINLEGDHAPSAYIRPCGLEGVELITLEEILGTAPPRGAVIEAISAGFASVFCRHPQEMPDDLWRVLQDLPRETGIPEQAPFPDSNATSCEAP
jgi:lipoate-protein ligase B